MTEKNLAKALRKLADDIDAAQQGRSFVGRCDLSIRGGGSLEIDLTVHIGSNTASKETFDAFRDAFCSGN